MKKRKWMEQKSFLCIIALSVLFNFTTIRSADCEEIQSEFLYICKQKIDPKADSNTPIPCGYGNIIKGKTSNIPDNMYPWLIVHPTRSRGYWPQQSAIIPHPKKNTWQKEVWIGTRGSKLGEKFELWLILVNEAGNQSYINYLTNGNETGKYPEIPMPSGYKTVDMITLIKQNHDEF